MAIVKNNEFEMSVSVITALIARRVRYWNNLVFPSVFLGRFEMDVAVISGSNFLTEYEIKLTLADWKRDAAKNKWHDPMRMYVARMFYVVPVELIKDTPEWVVEKGIGVLAVHAGGGLVVEVEKPKRRKNAQPVTPRMLDSMRVSLYYKFWRTRMDAIRI